MNSKKVELNKFNYFSIKDIPNKDQLKTFYSKKYFQSEKDHKNHYSKKELNYIENKLKQKFEVLKSKIQGRKNNINFLDIGCGEGWALSFMDKKGFNVFGIDYSEYAIKIHNENMIKKFKSGDIEENLKMLIDQKKFFDVIFLDNVLEHVINPESVLELVNRLSNKKSILIIEVPNDFSPMQMYLLKNKQIKNQYWVTPPDHLSYFNDQGLNNICQKFKWKKFDNLTDFPIELYLLNETSNYNKNKNLGRNAHNARIEFENFLGNISTERVNNLYRSMANIGLGRNIINFYEK
jgi:2-polyprenyl-3-methyl-5-hydroxy-6-metoxy-1,4-benzoquinol methylase